VLVVVLGFSTAQYEDDDEDDSQDAMIAWIVPE